MFVSYDIIYCPICFNPIKPSNTNLNSRNNSKMRKIIIPRRKNRGPNDTVIQEITDEDGLL